MEFLIGVFILLLILTSCGKESICWNFDNTKHCLDLNPGKK